MEKKGRYLKNSDISYLGRYLPFITGILGIVLYRIALMKDYLFLYTDDDQALMWYGTAAASHFQLYEPHFLGQSYGSMIESIIAVPLYWSGIGLHACLPMATFVLWIAPFILLSLNCLKKDRCLFSGIILMTSLLCGWDYDILTGVPRSFIGGFIFAFCGILLLEIDGKLKKAAAVILMAVGYVQTETTITIIALGILHYLLLNYDKIKKDLPFLGSGVIIGAIYVWFTNTVFYRIHPEYIVHASTGVNISLQVFQENCGHIGQVLSTFSLGNEKYPLLLSIGILCVIMVMLRFKRWKDLFLMCCAMMGSISFFFLSKTLDYRDTLLFSQSRMFLFIPYVVILILFYLSDIENDVEPVVKKSSLYRISAGFMAILILLIGIGKTVYFETEVVHNEKLYNDPVVNVEKVSDVYNIAGRLYFEAMATGVDTVIFRSDNRGIGYATSAVNYEQYLGYNAFYDRRTPTYLYLKTTVYNRPVLIVQLDGTEKRVYVENINDTTPVDWLRKAYGLQRYPETSPFYVRES